MAKQVVSTLANDQRYAQWDTSSGVGTIERSVLVRGQAGVAVKGLEKPYTPGAVTTQVSDDDAKFLAEHKLFQEHQAKGHVKIMAVVRDVEKTAQSMEKDDGSRPKTPEDVEKSAKGKDDTLQAVTNAKK